MVLEVVIMIMGMSAVFVFVLVLVFVFVFYDYDYDYAHRAVGLPFHKLVCVVKDTSVFPPGNWWRGRP